MVASPRSRGRSRAPLTAPAPRAPQPRTYACRVSAENIEFLRRLYGRWADGDFDTASYFDDRFEVVLRQNFPDSGVHRGTEGVAAYMRDFLEPWERITIEAEELTGHGDRVLARVHQAGTGESSGAAVELRYFHLWTFEDGAPVRMESIMDEAEARAQLESN
jgi:ketosteroid isomerase-like protein